MPTNTERLELRRRRMAESPAVLRGGFRPFFLGAALWAAVALCGWLALLFGLVTQTWADDPVAWHRHEMLFGFVGAAIAGFSLTAVPNWTGRLPIAGAPLAALFGLWATGRVLPFFVSDRNVLLIALDGGFYLVLAALLAREICKSHNRNLPIVAIIAAFGIAALVDRAMMAGYLDAGTPGWKCGLALVIILLCIIGGRIIPSFTRNWLMAQGEKERLPSQPDRLDQIVLAATLVALLAWLASPDAFLVGTLLWIAAAGNLARLLRWQGVRCCSNAILIVLHIAYLWIPIGLLLLGLARIAVIPESPAIHALSTGAMATMILAVMTRASLGHTGRPLVASRATAASYAMVSLAAVARVWAGFAMEEQHILLAWAGIAWIAAFGLFLAEYVPILFSARVEAMGKVQA